MPRHLWVFSTIFLSACLSSVRAAPHVSSKEAAQVELPLALPKETRRHIPGNTAAAIQLALEAFRHKNVKPTTPLYPEQACLARPESYRITTAPISETIVLVRFVVNLDVCDPGEPLVALTTYAVDVRTLRILAVGQQAHPRNPADSADIPGGSAPTSMPH